MPECKGIVGFKKKFNFSQKTNILNRILILNLLESLHRTTIVVEAPLNHNPVAAGSSRVQAGPIIPRA